MASVSVGAHDLAERARDGHRGTRLMAQSVGQLEKIRAMAATARHLVMGGHRAASESVITVYDHVAEKLGYTISVPSHVHALAVSGDTLIAGCADGLVRLYTIKVAAG